MPKWGNGRPPVYKQEMEFESLKLGELNEYGTIAGSNPAFDTNLNLIIMARCTYCGKSTDDSGSGTNMGTQNKPMCERCYEHGGDDD